MRTKQKAVYTSHLACRRGHLDISKYLVDEVHCNPSCKDRIGNTPLHHVLVVKVTPTLHNIYFPPAR